MRRDWRDTVRVATDLALLGLLTILAALPVVTAGAAVATASAAINHHLEYDRWPAPRFCRAVFRRRLLSGFLATLAAAAATALLVADLLALRAGVVPGGAPLMVITVAVAAAAAGYTGLRVVAAGRADSDRYAEQTSPARPGVTGRPAAVAAAAGIVTIAAVLSTLVHPVLVPVLAGYTLFGLHVIARRLPGRTPASALLPDGPAPAAPVLVDALSPYPAPAGAG